MIENSPRVSIGLPVFNGEDFLAEALDSILAQTYADLELVISDNASTDGTAEICRAYAARDPRVRYYRNEENLGAGWNYNRTFHLASGEYFKWQSHDDLCEPTFVEKCVTVLGNEPSIVLCYSLLAEIDEHGNELRIRRPGARSDQVRPHERFRSLSDLQPGHMCEQVFGVMRADVLSQTALIANYADSDRTLLAELSLHGPFYEIPEVLFRRRFHEKTSCTVYSGWRARRVWFDPKLAGKTVFPVWQNFFAYLAAIRRSPVSWGERIYCYYHMLTWFWTERMRLARDLYYPVKMGFRRDRGQGIEGHKPGQQGTTGSQRTSAEELS